MPSKSIGIFSQYFKKNVFWEIILSSPSLLFTVYSLLGYNTAPLVVSSPSSPSPSLPSLLSSNFHFSPLYPFFIFLFIHPLVVLSYLSFPTSFFYPLSLPFSFLWHKTLFCFSPLSSLTPPPIFSSLYSSFTSFFCPSFALSMPLSFPISLLSLPPLIISSSHLSLYFSSLLSTPSPLSTPSSFISPLFLSVTFFPSFVFPSSLVHFSPSRHFLHIHFLSAFHINFLSSSTPAPITLRLMQGIYRSTWHD